MLLSIATSDARFEAAEKGVHSLGDVSLHWKIWTIIGWLGSGLTSGDQGEKIRLQLLLLRGREVLCCPMNQFRGNNGKIRPRAPSCFVSMAELRLKYDYKRSGSKT